MGLGRKLQVSLQRRQRNVFGIKEKKEEKVEEEAIKIFLKRLHPQLLTQIFVCGIRSTLERANAMLNELESAFNQFGKPQQIQLNGKGKLRAVRLWKRFIVLHLGYLAIKRVFRLTLENLQQCFISLLLLFHLQS